MLRPAEGRQDVGHFGNATGRGVLRLSSSASAGIWTPAEKGLKNSFSSPSIEVGDFCICHFAFITKKLVPAVSLTVHKTFVPAVSLTVHKTFAERS
ncbi:hypothetical protein LAV72_21795 [Lysinibacillus xylanilyticus]|uniref:hypothetical protein n=1 Tax=Lysinibacillus xylanilyticus TaxID=582475 RepID=UPI002B247FB6|nr:hypothetical protein [Lysinibacillus xylanilyticus]MEB2302241.1 hypothetical protein [Lysinibacillus xylanilyticus]